MDLPAPVDAATVANGFQASDITAIAGVVVAVCALFITIWQTRSTKQHATTSVRPLLVVSVEEIESGSNFSTLKVYLENVGLGPAIIKSWEVYENNQLINDQSISIEMIKNTESIPQLTQIGFAFDKLKIPGINLEHGVDKKKDFAIKSGSKEPILILSYSKSSTNSHNALNGIDHLKLMIKYQDLYQNTQPILDTSKNKLLPY